jgi:hypothetical protein
LKWAAEIPAGRTKPGKKTSMRLIRTSKDDVIAFEINGAVSAEAVSSVMAELQQFLDSHDKVRMLAHIKHFGGVDPALFMQSGLMSMKLAAMQKVERYAIVGAPAWMQKAVRAMNPMFPDIDMRPFNEDEQDQAWNWLGAKAAE